MTIDDLKNGGKPVAPTITDGFIPTLEELPDQSTPNIYANKGHILDIGAIADIVAEFFAGVVGAVERAGFSAF